MEKSRIQDGKNTDRSKFQVLQITACILNHSLQTDKFGILQLTVNIYFFSAF
jgi:hypothetical protein